MYYVYEWFILQTNEVIYVGKGSGKRYKVRKHNKFFNDMIKRFECASRIVKEFENEEDAFHYEHERVAQLKEIGQCVCNIYAGGYGGTTSWWTEERRHEYSAKNAMKSENQRNRMSLKNPMKNPEIVKVVVEQKRRAVIIDGIEYSSVKDVVEKFDVAFQTVKHWCDKGVNPNGQICRYKDAAQKVFVGKRYNKGGCREIIYDGKIYESGIDLAVELGISNSTVTLWAQKGFSPKGVPCRYADDTRCLVFEGKPKSWWNKKPIIVNGIKYPSRKDAEDALGLKRGYLAPYMNGTRKNKKYICKYDNQQPNRGKSDNSTPEGSTTNG